MHFSSSIGPSTCPVASTFKLADTATPPSSPVAAFAAFVGADDFPCVGAKSALHKDRMRHGQYDALGHPANSRQLLADLAAFAAEFPDPGTAPVSFIATFGGTADLDETAFEAALWQQLQSLHDGDEGQPWDASVSSDPAANDFSMSIGGRAYFVVGLHPRASRLARRAPMATLVFNFHNQFENLKANGKYEGMQKAIRARDVALQGFVNPVLSRFGDASEARQYAGRAVAADWQCPFRQRAA